MESRFGPFGDKIGALFALNVPWAQKSFWTHPLVLLGDVAQVEPRFGLVEIVLILTQDWSMVFAEC
jgi:hypothetical protein